MLIKRIQTQTQTKKTDGQRHTIIRPSNDRRITNTKSYVISPQDYYEFSISDVRVE